VTGASRAILLGDEAATRNIARLLAAAALPGDLLALSGPLGSGKSVFARAFVRALAGEHEEVPSPTFTLVQNYDAAIGTIWHFDLYRLRDREEAFELGWEDALVDLVLVEWPERLGGLLPARRVDIALEETAAAESRLMRLEARGGSTLLDRVGAWP
jgi:tRNA threonylcarbamoyladenosine biosynthesis protein TsaE